jgi:hypothetical protein
MVPALAAQRHRPPHPKPITAPVAIHAPDDDDDDRDDEGINTHKGRKIMLLIKLTSETASPIFALALLLLVAVRVTGYWLT